MRKEKAENTYVAVPFIEQKLSKTPSKGKARLVGIVIVFIIPSLIGGSFAACTNYESQNCNRCQDLKYCPECPIG